VYEGGFEEHLRHGYGTETILSEFLSFSLHTYHTSSKQIMPRGRESTDKDSSRAKAKRGWWKINLISLIYSLTLTSHMSGRQGEGDYDSGVLNGDGRLKNADGSVFEGHFINGRRHGQGVQRRY